MTRQYDRQNVNPKGSTAPEYQRIVEVLNFYRQGYAPGAVARWLDLDLEEVHEIIDDQRAYQLRRGLRPHHLSIGKPMPTPDELVGRIAEVRAANLAEKAASGPASADDYMPQVYPEHPHRRRCGY